MVRRGSGQFNISRQVLSSSIFARLRNIAFIFVPSHTPVPWYDSVLCQSEQMGWHVQSVIREKSAIFPQGESHV